MYKIEKNGLYILSDLQEDQEIIIEKNIKVALFDKAGISRNIHIGEGSFVDIFSLVYSGNISYECIVEEKSQIKIHQIILNKEQCQLSTIAKTGENGVKISVKMLAFIMSE